MQPTQNINYDKLEDEINAINNTFGKNSPFHTDYIGRIVRKTFGKPAELKSISTISAFIQSNRNMFYHKPLENAPPVAHMSSKGDLQKSLQTLAANVQRVYPDSNEKKELMAQIRQAISLGTNNSLSTAELRLNKIEPGLPAGFFHIERDAEGRIIDPVGQLKKLKEVILGAIFLETPDYEQLLGGGVFADLKEVFGHRPAFPPPIIRRNPSHTDIAEDDYIMYADQANQILDKYLAAPPAFSANFHPFTRLGILEKLKNTPNLNIRLEVADFKEGEIPSEIFNLTNLTYLRLSNCQIDTLPEEIANCTQLKELSLHNLSLVGVPYVIAKLPNLEKISCSIELFSIIAGSGIKSPPLKNIKIDSTIPPIEWNSTGDVSLEDFLKTHRVKHTDKL